MIAFRGALPSFGAPAFGVGLASLWLLAIPLVPIVLVVLSLAAGVLLDGLGRASLPGRPERAVALMEFWGLIPSTAVAAFSGIVLLLAIEVAKWSDVGLSQNWLALIQAALAVLAGWAAQWVTRLNNLDRAVGKHIYEAFDDVYRSLPPGSPGANAVYGDFCGDYAGWGWHARRCRASEVAAYLRAGTSS